jgi:ribokinase
MDLVARVPKLPKPGETLTGYSFTTVPGGKGANQAVAVAKLGGASQMIGRVGNDAFGQELRTSLETAGVEIDRVAIDHSAPSGVAMIAVDNQGENHIIVIPGTNHKVDHADLDRLTLTRASILLLQLEIPCSIVQAAAKTAKTMGSTVILDPAPAPAAFPDELYRDIDILTPNTTEAEQLVGFAIQHLADAERAAEVLQTKGTKIVIIKMGAQGAYCATQYDRFFTPAFLVNAIDTVAAGDAFNAGLAVALAEGHPIREAVRWGAASGALSTTKTGAQSSLCDRATFDTFLLSQTKP